MWFWNRREVYMGNSLEDFARVRQTLALNGIRYDCRVIDHSSPGPFGSDRARFGTLGLNLSILKYYYVYVHKDSLEKAGYLINKRD